MLPNNELGTIFVPEVIYKGPRRRLPTENRLRAVWRYEI